LLLLLWLAAALANHYQNLGVARDANAGAVKAAFRRVALKDHPDKQPKEATAAGRAQAERRFQKANEAFDVLSDPAQRRKYDHSLVAPGRQGPEGAAGAPQPAPRPLVEVKVRATLPQMGGWEPAEIEPEVWSTALGAPMSRQAAERLGLPLRVYLPPGTASADRVRISLPALNIDVDLVIVRRRPGRWARAWEREGDDLRTTLTLPAWHNVLRRRVRLRNADGQTHTLLRKGAPPVRTRRGATVQRGRPDVVRVAGAGMPVRDAAGPALSAERGELRVFLEVRALRDELVLAAARLGLTLITLLGAAAARRTVPGALRGARATAAGYAWRGLDQLLRLRHALSWHVLGRFNPENARARRQEARMRRSARQAAEAQKQRQKKAEEVRGAATRWGVRAWNSAFDKAPIKQ